MSIHIINTNNEEDDLVNGWILYFEQYISLYEDVQLFSIAITDLQRNEAINYYNLHKTIADVKYEIEVANFYRATSIVEQLIQKYPNRIADITNQKTKPKSFTKIIMFPNVPILKKP